MPNDPAPLTPAERAAREQAHVEWPYVHPSGYRGVECRGCGMRWPCDVARLLATVAALEAERDQYAAVVRAARIARESDPLLLALEQPELRRHLLALWAAVAALPKGA